MINKILCSTHQENILMIDTNKQAKRRNRLYCQKCLENSPTDQLIQLNENLIQNHISREAKEIQKEYNIHISQLKNLIQSQKLFKGKLIEAVNQNITMTEQVLNSVIINMEHELELNKMINQTKLNEIAEIMSGYKFRESNLSEIKFKLAKVGQQIAYNMKYLVQLGKEISLEYQSAFLEKKVLKFQFNCYEQCQVLAQNVQNKIVVGGVGKSIIVWKQKRFQGMEQCAVLCGHTENIMALVLYKSGNQIVSGGVDKQLRLWRIADQKWKFISTSSHDMRITDIKLTQQENQLLSISDDRKLRVWRLIEPQSLLECIQQIKHTEYLYHISITPCSEMMAFSCLTKQVITHRQKYQEPWKKYITIKCQGCINRIHFTDSSHLICQQSEPNKLILYELTNEQSQITQEISLNESDPYSIQFPICQYENIIYIKCKNEILVIKQSKDGLLKLSSTIQGIFKSGCVDVSGKGIFLGNQQSHLIEYYSDY